MIKRISKKYAMTEKGAKDYVAAVFWSVLVNISKMLPVGVLAAALSGIAQALTDGTFYHCRHPCASCAFCDLSDPVQSLIRRDLSRERQPTHPDSRDIAPTSAFFLRKTRSD